jgi:predicted ATPase
VRRYVLTGAPGSGKTSILRALGTRGYAVIEEAATDVIARGQALGVDEPWTNPAFLDDILEVQRQRQQERPHTGVEVQVYDRSPLCTLALARYGGHDVPVALSDEIDRMAREQLYERHVFFVRPLGFIEPTAARRITYENTLAFERIHREVYVEHGYALVDVPPGEVAARAALIDTRIVSWG